MTRRGWAIVILGAWVASLGWLVKRQVFRPAGARLAEAALSVPPGAVYYRLDVAGQQVGFASSTIDTIGTNVQVTDVLVLHVPALGVLHRTAALSRATLSRALRLERVDAKFDGDLGQFTVRGIVTGDTLLALTLGSGGDSGTTRLRLARPIALPSVLPLRLAFGGELKPGRTYTLAAFDPMLLEQRAVRVTVAAESTLVIPDSAAYDSTAMAWVPVHFDTVHAVRIDETSGARMRTWIDAQGHIVRAEAPAGFAMTRSAFELAYVNFRHRDTARVARASAAPQPGDVIATTAIAAHETLRRAAVPLMRFRLSAPELAGGEIATGRQRLSGDTLVVRREGVEDLRASYRLPARDTALTEFLAPEPLIQSDDPRIQAQARLIVGREREPARAARLIHDWVHGNLRPGEPGDEVPNALGVLATRRGDCNEYTVLYVALARAAGLPARSVAGLLYLDGRFYYHAWPEVYLAGWVAVDPAADQFPADAAHLRFAIGGLARQAELVRLIGGLKVEVL